MDSPTTPSQTLKIKKINNIYDSENIFVNKKVNIQNNLKIINSSLKRLNIICLRAKHKDKIPEQYIIK